MKNNRVELDTFIKSVCGNRSISPFHYGAVELPVDLDKSVEIQKRKDEKKNVDMAFTFTNPEISGNANKFDWANTAIVVAYNYMQNDSYETTTKPGYSRIASFAKRDYYEPLRTEINLIMDSLNKEGHRTESFVDDSSHYDRLFFVYAGLGWQGKSTMMLSPGIGPWQLIGTIYTAKKIIQTKKSNQACGECNYCQISCPTGALNQDYVLDANLCIAYWLQSSKIIPRDMRVAIGNRLYGCDECLVSCPPGQREVQFKAKEDGVKISRILNNKDEELLAEYKRFYIPKMDSVYIRRNALISLANNPDDSAVTIFTNYLSHHNPELVIYAIWGLWRISRVDIIQEYYKKRKVKSNIVQEEIDWAIKMPS
mgnify:FL=1|tara:strand:- start:272 stop:1375 length:1104 start_codon:yes stop_codon:yes gene_type:complete